MVPKLKLLAADLGGSAEPALAQSAANIGSPTSAVAGSPSKARSRHTAIRRNGGLAAHAPSSSSGGSSGFDNFRAGVASEGSGSGSIRRSRSRIVSLSTELSASNLPASSESGAPS